MLVEPYALLNFQSNLEVEVRSYAEEAKDEIIRCGNEVLAIGKEFAMVLRPQMQRAKESGDNEKMQELNTRSEVLVQACHAASAKAEMYHTILKAMRK
jgi:hypothetical protein